MSMDWDELKDNFEMGALYTGVVLGGIVLAPFYGVYQIGKGVYYYLPSSIRKRKEQERQEQAEKEKKNRRDAEIKELERRLGTSTENKFRIYFDKYYYKNPGDPQFRSRDEYLEDLRQKAVKNYVSPDMVVAVECYDPKYYEGLYKAGELSGSFDEYWEGDKRILYKSQSWSPKTSHAHKKGQMGLRRGKTETSTPVRKDCYVVLLIHKDRYRVPEDALIRHKETVHSEELGDFAFTDSAKFYFTHFSSYMNYFTFHPSQMTEPVKSYFRRLYTLMECGNHDDYFIVQVPGEFQFPEVEAGTDEQLNEFIANFKRKYKKGND